MQRLSSEETKRRIRQIERGAGRVGAFGLHDDARNTQYTWHSHSRHQLVVALRGSLHIEAERKRYILPPQRALWISAGTLHRTTIFEADCFSVFFQRTSVRWIGEPVQVIAATPLLREMVKHAASLGTLAAGRKVRTQYFQTLALMCGEWLRTPLPFWLPETSDPQIAQAIHYTLENLQTGTAVDASSAAGMSERSFRRHFQLELGMNWRDYITKARLLHAMELLGRQNMRVVDVANEVGFISPSAFTKAFSALTSETPKEYQRRLALKQ